MGNRIKTKYKPPLELIQFVAKTGFITKALWKDFFFKGGTRQWKNLAWASLTERKYFRKHASKRCEDILVLKKELRFVRELLPSEPVSVPHVYQLTHDENLMRGLLLLLKEYPELHWQTEGELKKQSALTYRITDNGNKTKYPDLLISFDMASKNVNIAIELERKLKSRKRYVQILGAYRTTKDIDYILFLVSNETIKKTIMEIMTVTYFPSERIRVVFASEKKWLEDAPLLTQRIKEMHKKSKIETELRTFQTLSSGKSWAS